MAMARHGWAVRKAGNFATAPESWAGAALPDVWTQTIHRNLTVGA
jgi:hypothetical protein